MKKIIACLAFLGLLSSCSVTETITFTDDGSGEFLVSYDMGEMMAQMKETMGNGTDNSSKKETKKVMDTTMVFADIMEAYKDSVAVLSEDKKMTLEAVKNMYMKMHMDEDKGIMNMGIGMKFNSIAELKDIQERIKKVQSLNAQSSQADAMKNGSPLGKFTGNEDAKVAYNFTKNGFTRTTTMPVMTEEEYDAVQKELFDEEDETDKEFMKYFEASYYTVKLVFPKKVKSVDVEGAEISKDGKTVTYKSSWIDYIKNPQSLDASVKFYE